MRHRLAAVLLALASTVLLAACGQVEEPGQVVVFAASSLTDAFGDLGSKWDASGSKAAFNFAGSQSLVTQMAQGAQADVFAAADTASMDAAISEGVVQAGTEEVLATNRLVVAVAPGASIATLQDLARPGLRLVLAADSVPAGSYSLQLLDKLAADPAYGAAYKDAVLANVVSRESNVRQVAAKVQLGEADAGIVYRTDVRDGKVGTIEIADEYNVVAHYMIAPVKGGSNPVGAKAFIEYALSDTGQSMLMEQGFGRATEVDR